MARKSPASKAAMPVVAGHATLLYRWKWSLMPRRSGIQGKAVILIGRQRFAKVLLCGRLSSRHW
ncbi:hypothetical protein KCP75_14120 [Salmonella enterica subsp. enterica]|nr:hypothetical protein KCP75_14120 [Salmonella enterica subsp. enterica]